MEALLDIAWLAREEPTPYGAALSAAGSAADADGPLPHLEPFTRAELLALFRGGEREADLYDELLVNLARLQGQVDAALAEGLHALRRKDRLATLGFRLPDHGRELLDIAPRTTLALAQLGAALHDRPLLQAALRAGKVSLRAAQTVLPVARGEREAWWVAASERRTVRELAVAVRAARKAPEAPSADDDEPWHRLGVRLTPPEAVVVEHAFEVGERLEPGLSRLDLLERMTMEFLGTFPAPDARPSRALGFRPLGSGAEPLDGPERAAQEAEGGRWQHLPAASGGFDAAEYTFGEDDSAQSIDAKLRKLARRRRLLEHVLGFAAHAIKAGGVHLRLGFRSFREYVTERLGLPVRAVEQRVALEKRIQASAALQALRRSGLSYERLRLLSRLPEQELAAWGERARAMPCAALADAIEDRSRAQLCAHGKFSLALPARVAVLLAAVIQEVRTRGGGMLSAGRCLAVMACHFIATWTPHVRRQRSTRSRQVRERDRHRCQVPGCSARAAHAHHRQFRSHGGSDALENQLGLCAFHHLVCVHGSHLTVEQDRETGELRWWLGGQRFTGIAEPVTTPSRHATSAGASPAR